MRFSEKEIKKIKLIIWDLDETFWKGTLSDNGDDIDAADNCRLVRELTDRGIISSICSKNDLDPVKNKLTELGVWDLFVFCSINWDAKGERIKAIIEAMALRPVNVLFIDDNPANLAEAEFVLPDIMVAGPEVASVLAENVGSIGKDDKSHTRLKQYQVLEEKKKVAMTYSSNEEFLRNSGIQMHLSPMSMEKLDRVAELIERSNQLNFTKVRISKAELEKLINDSEYSLGYAEVKDNYGDYGLVGFYALRKKDNTLEHFLFSCRTMGMGIEQYVYSYLGCPSIDIVPPVSGSISAEAKAPEYISLVDEYGNAEMAPADGNKLKVLLKGSCDLEVMATYLEAGNIALTREFNFIDSNGNQADYCNHGVNVLKGLEGKDDEIKSLTDDYSFLSEEGFRSSLKYAVYDYICLSPLMDATLAVYRNNDTGKLFAYGLCNKRITDPQHWEEYIGKTVMTARSTFTLPELKKLADSFTGIEYTPEMIAGNYGRIIDHVHALNEDCRIVMITLPELPFTDGKDDFSAEKHNYHRAINKALYDSFKDKDYIYFLDVNKYIKSQADYFDNINHYSKLVYYRMAKELADYINSETGACVKTKSNAKARIDNIKRNIYKRVILPRK